MANECHCTLVVGRADGKKLSAEELGAFIREQDSSEGQGTEVEGLDKKYYFSYQFVVPVKQDDNWWDNNINARSVKRDGGYYCIGSTNEYNGLTLHFATPWGPPINWFKAVLKKFPDLGMQLSYDEPLMGFQGKIGRKINGELFNEYREGEEYLDQCFECGENRKDVKYRKDFEDFLCDGCYKKNLHINK